MVKRALRVKAERRVQAGRQRGGSADAEADGSGAAPPQHLQRKVLRRVRFLEKVAAARPALAPRGGGTRKKRRRKGAGAPDLGALDLNLTTLAASLADAEREVQQRVDAPQKGLGAGGAKARSRIVASETQRLRQVHAHPQFRADPIAAVASHLAATLPPAPAPPKAPADPAKRRQQRQLQKQRRKERRMAEG
ncbi:hypothetical protein WJX81_001709 [Elliptochloris bilobata]|uniref:Ribosome biogenesis protein SLX9 n=1 Tax=Elliptochloris bilobata TaxID=381761 RepID=A0AAW1RZA0_9CHLO